MPHRTIPPRAAARRSLALAVLVSGAVTSPAAHAFDRYWVGGGTGDWNNTANWSNLPNGAPGFTSPASADNAFVIRSIDTTVVRNAGGSIGALLTVQLDGTGGAVVTFDKSGATLMGAGTYLVGSTGNGQVIAGAGGTLSASTVFMVGQQVGSAGTVTTAATVLPNTFVLGANGLGHFTQNGAFVQSPNSVVFGESANGRGTYVLNSGSAQWGGNGLFGTFVGLIGHGTLIQNGGTMIHQTAGGGVTGLHVGSGGSSGTVLMSGGTMSVFSPARLGDPGGAGRGLFQMTGGSITMFNGLVVGANSSFVNAGGSVAFGGAPVTVNGGTIDLGAAGFTLNVATPTTITNGYFGSARITSVGGASLQFNSGTVDLINDGLNRAANPIFGTGSLNLTSTKTLRVGGPTTLVPTHPIVLNGGTFATTALAGDTSGLVWNTGTVRLLNDLTIGTGGPFGDSLVLNAGMRLEGGAGVTAVDADGQLVVRGGTFAAPTAIFNLGLLQLDSPTARVVAPVLINGGLLTGSGRVLASLTNQADGEVRVETGQLMRFEAAANSNSSQITLLGGTADFTGTLNNASSGRITGRGTLRTAGLSNAGSVLLSGGLTDVFGGVTNTSGGKTIVTGNAVATFYDAVANDPGSEFRVSTGSTAVFFGPVTGGAQFTGPGTKVFESSSSLGPVVTTGTTVVGPDALVQAQHLRERSLAVEGELRVLAGPSPNAPSGTSVVKTFSIAASGVVDLANNSMVIDYDTAGPNAALEFEVREHLRAGRIASSDATATRRLGYADNAALGANQKTTFAGQTVDAGSVLIKYTTVGDADLDGDTDGGDIAKWAQNFTGSLAPGTGAKVWTSGDWDYDGDTDGADAALWAAAFTGSLAPGLGTAVVIDSPISASAAAVLSGMGVVVVPEPVWIGAPPMLTFVVSCLAQQRRRSGRLRRPAFA